MLNFHNVLNSSTARTPHFDFSVFPHACVRRSENRFAHQAKAAFLAIFAAICTLPAQANLVLTAPPRESVERGEELY